MIRMDIHLIFFLFSLFSSSSIWGRRLKQTWDVRKYVNAVRPESFSKNANVVAGMWVMDQDKEEYPKSNDNLHSVGPYVGSASVFCACLFAHNFLYTLLPALSCLVDSLLDLLAGGYGPKP